MTCDNASNNTTAAGNLKSELVVEELTWSAEENQPL